LGYYFLHLTKFLPAPLFSKNNKIFLIFCFVWKAITLSYYEKEISEVFLWCGGRNLIGVKSNSVIIVLHEVHEAEWQRCSFNWAQRTQHKEFLNERYNNFLYSHNCNTYPINFYIPKFKIKNTFCTVPSRVKFIFGLQNPEYKS